MTQRVFHDDSAFDLMKSKKVLLVCDGAFDSFKLSLPFDYVKFSKFTSNPRYEDVFFGVIAFKEYECNFILAVGGGSAIDAAKCIKYYGNGDIPETPIMAVPTTSGTGSEATRFAVVYKNGEKQSVSSERILPEYVLFRPDLVKSLPVYQKKCTMLDALCQAVESWWSYKSNPESVNYSEKAIGLILKNMDGYLENDDESVKRMLMASNYAGKAINITTTTAPHAMSYKLTSLYGLPHGHAVAICLPKVWEAMGNFDYIARAFGCRSCREAVLYFEKLLEKLEIYPPPVTDEIDLDVLTGSVNEERLQNNPIRFDTETIRELYKKILKGRLR